MKCVHFLAATFVGLLVLPAYAQDRPPLNRPPAPAATTPARGPEATPGPAPVVSRAMAESMRRREEGSVDLEDRVNVVPDAVVRFMPVRLLQRDDDSVADDEWVMRIIAAPNAPQLVPVLRPLMSQAGHMAAMAEDGGQSGKLILMDTYGNLRKLTEVINTLAR